ncbi:MAG: SMI1/KNR4 family protein [Myxococcota bacterium]
MKNFIKGARRFYDSRAQAKFGRPEGASQNEIAAVETELGRTLPGAYREFLEWMGNDFEGIFRGTDCYLMHLLPNTAWLPEFIEEVGVVGVDTSTLVCFWSHHGYMAAWFDGAIRNDDPVCWAVSDSDDKVRSIGHFSDYLQRCIQDVVK